MSDRPERYFLRIPLFHRLLHGVLMLSFLGLAATGLPLRFHSAPWAAQAAALLGGFGAILALHKLLALALSLASQAAASYDLTDRARATLDEIAADTGVEPVVVSATQRGLPLLVTGELTRNLTAQHAERSTAEDAESADFKVLVVTFRAENDLS